MLRIKSQQNGIGKVIEGDNSYCCSVKSYKRFNLPQQNHGGKQIKRYAKIFVKIEQVPACSVPNHFEHCQ